MLMNVISLVLFFVTCSRSDCSLHLKCVSRTVCNSQVFVEFEDILKFLVHWMTVMISFSGLLFRRSYRPVSSTSTLAGVLLLNLSPSRLIPSCFVDPFPALMVSLCGVLGSHFTVISLG